MWFTDNGHLLKIIEKIASGVGRRIDESSPMVDARLPGGSGVNAFIPPLALASSSTVYFVKYNKISNLYGIKSLSALHFHWAAQVGGSPPSPHRTGREPSPEHRYLA